jgi:hypothetical protein
MDVYDFTYRRVKGKCLHCKKLEKRSGLRRVLDDMFRRKRLREDARRECEFEWRSFSIMGHGPENFTETTVKSTDGQRKYETVDAQNRDRMILYFKDGSLKTIASWSDCELRLGTDWVLFTKNRMERESGQDVKLAVDAGR